MSYLDDLNRILDIGITLAKERSYNHLLERILDVAMDMTGCDAGTLYMQNEGRLEACVMIMKSKGIFMDSTNKPINLPPVELTRDNVCACAAMDRELINVSDVCHDERYDFSSVRQYDAIMGYHTVSMLVLPMENDQGSVIGVVQLINARDEDGNVVAFREEYNRPLMAIGCQAAISIASMQYRKDVVQLLDSFVRVMSTAIDERSPYNANHTKNMVKYGRRFIRWLDEHEEGWKFDEKEANQFLMSVWLHDVGKLVIPLEVMDKDSRLGVRIYDVKKRLKIVELLDYIAFLEHRITEEEYEKKKRHLEEVLDLVLRVNKPGFVPDEVRKQIEQLRSLTFLDTDGKVRPWFIEEEMEALLVQKGTLTPREREMMESHVVRAMKILGEMTFSEQYQDVPKWAASHHEFLDGSGYPERKMGDEIPKEVRLMTILDIFEALTAKDRPYRSAMNLNQALDILDSMAEEGKLDGEILRLFKKSEVWREDLYEEK